MALLRTCQPIYDEALPFVEARLENEPSRYIFDVQSIRSFNSCVFFNIFYEMFVVEGVSRTFKGGTFQEIRAQAKSEASTLHICRGKPEDKTFSGSGTGPLTLSTADPEFFPITDFVVQCVHWNRLIDNKRSNKGGGQDPCVERFDTLHIGIRVPPVATDLEMERYFWLTGCIYTPRSKLSIVIQPACGENQQRNADFHEKRQPPVNKDTRTWHPARPAVQPHPIKQPTMEEWDRDWEEGDVN